MKHGLAGAALAALMAAAGSAEAGDLSFGAGLRDLSPSSDGLGLRYGSGLKELVPAPIPVPAPMPVPEGFTYYLRADLNWGFSSNRSLSESGAIYGQDSTAAAFTSSAIPFTSGDDNVFGGTIGFGAYFTPRLRGDLTLDFRQDQEIVSTGAYTFTQTGTGLGVTGSVSDNVKVSSAAGLANLYFDILPRGAITPYVGAGIGFVYNQITRTYRDTETFSTGATRTRLGSTKENDIALAAALMAGVSFSLDPRWAIDVGYRALYMDGAVATSTVQFTGLGAQQSKITLGDVWEHQVRVGMRVNLW